MATLKRIGVFGGTFDPVHNAHLKVAQAALDQAKLDTVLFVVAARPPHKVDYTVATPEDRYAMVQAAVAACPRFDASNIELDRNGPSYTAVTLAELHDREPSNKFFLIVGDDSFADFPNWKDPHAIVERAHLLVVPRPGENGVVPDWMDGAYDYLRFEQLPISSTDIRERVAAGRDISHLVPEPVERLMRKRGIYDDRTLFDTPHADDYLALVRKRLPEKTYRHVISVAQTAQEIAESAGISREQAVTAGLLHDLCKAMKPDALRARATDYGLTEYLDEANLLHGPVAAEECTRELGIDDDEVIDAIRWHTTGRADWGRVGQVLFYADFAEPRRTHPQSAEARRLFREEGFDAALRYVVDQKFTYVKTRFKPDPHAEAFAAWVKNSPGA